MSVRVRLAPSPSGYLHVGTARTAIFNFLFARKRSGSFLVRIEDTDVERSDASLIEPILGALKWLGISSDEPVVFQSQRLETYRHHAANLLSTGSAYPCFCTPQELEQERALATAEKRPPKYSRKCLRLPESEVSARLAAGVPHAIRLHIPAGETAYQDMVSGEIKRNNDDIEDFVAVRSDGSPTYNFAVVIDDHEMGISHVIRGNDHITNTFKQIHLYQAFGWSIPRFGHLPLILRPDRQKVSKRLGDKDVAQYQHEGILAEAMFNYLCLLGWSPKTDREIYTVTELIDIFDPANFNPSNAVFDEEKLVAFNKAHLLMRSDHELATMVAPLLVEAGVTTKYWLETRWEYLRAAIHLLKERVRRITDFVSLGSYFFSAPLTYDAKAASEHFSAEAAEVLEELAGRFGTLSDWNAAALEQILNGLAEERGLKKGRLIHPTRLAVSGLSVGPGLYDLLALVGQTAVIERMHSAVTHIRSRS